MSDDLSILILFSDRAEHPTLDGAARRRLARLGRVVQPVGRARNWTDEQIAAWLAEADVVLTGWSAPRLTIPCGGWRT